jgi:hypothetical protein
VRVHAVRHDGGCELRGDGWGTIRTEWKRELKKRTRRGSAVAAGFVADASRSPLWVHANTQVHNALHAGAYPVPQR